MSITITWHLILMIIISIALIIRIFIDSEGGLDFSSFFYGIIIVIIWAIYGGIFIW